MNRIGIGAALATALALSALSGQAMAKQCLVNKLKFENQGAYVVNGLTVNWGKESDANYDKRSGSVRGQESRTLDLSKSEGTAEKPKLQKGDEVWLTYSVVDANDNDRTCQKKDTQLIYDPDKGVTWVYWAKGSTQNGSRCRFRDNKCISPSSE